MALKACKECGNDVSTEAASCPKCGAVLKKKGGFWRFIVASFLIFITLIAIVALINGVTNRTSTTTSPAEVPTSAATTKHFEECREWLKKDQSSGLLYDLEWKKTLPKVVVGSTFYAIPIDQKQGLADRVNCFLMAGKSNYIDFDLLDWQTGKRVAQYSLGRLKMD